MISPLHDFANRAVYAARIASIAAQAWHVVILGICTFMLMVTSIIPAKAEPNSLARYAHMVDFDTGQVLFSKDANAPIPTASMSKVMTLLMLFEAIRDGRVSLDDRFPVSRYASKRGGSTMFLAEGSRARVEDLIRGIIVHSGNDASIVVAEGLSGSERGFAEEMNERAVKMGLTESYFANSTGWPDPEHYMSMRDLVEVSLIVIREFPEYYSYYAEKSFIYNKIKQNNRNSLLWSGEFNVDGIKTGHTEESGFGLLFSATKGGRRLVGVVQGLDSKRQRTEEAGKLIKWGFQHFALYRLFPSGAKISEVDVWPGSPSVVDIVTPQAITVVIPRAQRKHMKIVLAVTDPLFAPVNKGAPVASLLVSTQKERMEFSLVAGQSSARPGLIGRLSGSVRYMLFGSQAKP